MRKIAALTMAAGLLVSLAACTVTGPTGECTPVVKSGDASDVVTTTGDFGAEPNATFPTPIGASLKEAQRSTITTGKGATVYPGDYLIFSFTQYDSTTGEESFETQTTAAVASDDKTSINSLFTCATVGSRIAVAYPGTDGGGPAAVIIIDIAKAYTGRATGHQEIAAAAGLPSIVTAPDGTPGFTIPKTDAPTELTSSVLITGDGKKIAEGDTVILKYTIVNWATSTQVDSTWLSESKAPIVANLASASDSLQNGLADGVVAALKGKKAGSQVLVILPPATYLNGLGLNNTGTAITATSDNTLVIVYDILGVISSK